MKAVTLDALMDNPAAVAGLTAADRARLQAHVSAMVVRLGGLGLALAVSPDEQTPAAGVGVLTLQQVQQRLQLSKDTVARLVNTGELPHVKVGRRYRVTESALLEWQRAKESGR